LHDHRGYHEIEANIAVAREAAVFLAQNRIPYFCPHLNSCHFEVIVPAAPPEFWYEMDIRLLHGATAMLLLPGYMDSKGTLGEIEVAERLGINIFGPDERHLLLSWWGETSP